MIGAVISKVDQMQGGRLEFLYFLISAFLFLDFVSSSIYEKFIYEQIELFKVFEWIILFICYFVFFYIMWILRFMSATILDRYIKKDRYPEYFTLGELKEAAIHEDNQVKYAAYKDLMADVKRTNDLRALVFCAMVLLVICHFTPNSIINSMGLTSDPVSILISLIILTFHLIFALRVNQDESECTFIRKNNSKSLLNN